MAMSTLAQRLRKVQQPSPEPEYDFSHVSMDTLEVTKINFGKHAGKTFNHLWCEEQPWVLWFTQHFHKSTKTEHRQFLYYVDKKIERCELTGVKMPSHSAADQKTEASLKPTTQLRGTTPKAKAKSMPMPTVPTDPWDPEIEEDAELFEVLQEQELMSQIEPVMPAQNMQHMENRMQQMEDVLNRIVNYIEQNSTTLITEQ